MPASISSEMPNRDDEYTVEAHMRKTAVGCRTIFEELRQQIFAMHPHIEEKAVKQLVRYRAAKNFAEIHFLSDSLKIHLRPKQYIDLKSNVELVPNAGFTMDRRVYISNSADCDYVTGLIKQSYNDVPL